MVRVISGLFKRVRDARLEHLLRRKWVRASKALPGFKVALCESSLWTGKMCLKIAVCALVLVVSMACAESFSSDPMVLRLFRLKRSPEPLRSRSYVADRPLSNRGEQSRILYSTHDDLEGLVPAQEDEHLVASAQNHHGQRAQRRGYSGTVKDGKSQYISRYNHGVPVYGVGEPYYFSYTHNFPIGTEDFESLVNSHNLPKKYKFSGGLDVTGLLEH